MTITFRLPDGVDHRFGSDSDSGDETVVELSDEAWDDFRNERRTTFGLLYAGMVNVTKGRFEDVADWEAELRRQWDGRPLYDDAAAEAARALDLKRSFRLDDDPDEMAAFLRTAGFIHMRNVFDPAEVEEMRVEVERLKAKAEPDDGRSWWAKTRSGQDVCCRVIYMSQQSQRLASVPTDARMRRIVGLTGEESRPADDRMAGLAAVIKNPGALEGLSDLSSHR